MPYHHRERDRRLFLNSWSYWIGRRRRRRYLSFSSRFRQQEQQRLFCWSVCGVWGTISSVFKTTQFAAVREANRSFFVVKRRNVRSTDITEGITTAEHEKRITINNTDAAPPCACVVRLGLQDGQIQFIVKHFFDLSMTIPSRGGCLPGLNPVWPTCTL